VFAEVRATNIAGVVRRIIAEETKLPEAQLSDNESFETYGIESVLSVAIARRLEETFGELSKTLLFEYPTIAALVGYLMQDHAGDTLGEAAGLDVPPNPKSAADELDVAALETVRTSGQTSHLPRAERGALVREAKEAAQPTRGLDGNDIAIIGISGRFPQADTMEQFWENLAQGRDCITEIPERLWDWRRFWDAERGVEGKSYAKWGGFIDGSDCFDPLFFNISNLQAAGMDPQERLFLQAVYHTMEDAGYTRDSLRGSRVGLYVSAMWGDYQHYGARDASADSSFSSIANRASYFFDFKGPSIALDTTCSGSLTTVHLACESIRAGESDLAIAGGVNVTCHPHKYLVLSRTGFAANDGRCRSFGADGTGYVPGDGVGAVLLKPLALAVADGDRIHAVIKSTCINHGGRSSGFTVPSAEAQAALIDSTLRKANIDPRSISYVEAHAPGTALGDPIEVRGLTTAFRKYTADKKFCAIGSVKSNVGHLESAAGVASLAKVILQMQHQQLAPSIHSDRLNPNIQFENTPFYVQRELSAWLAPVVEEDGQRKRYPRRAGISAFGAGGSNAHIIVEEYRSPVGCRTPSSAEQLIVLSAKTPERLRAVVKNILEGVKRRLAPSASTSHHTPAEERILDLIGDLTGVRPSMLDMSDSLQDLLGPRRSFDELIARLRDDMGVMWAADIGRSSTIGDLVGVLTRPSADAAPNTAEHSSELLEQIAYTLQVGRESMPHRFATLVRSLPQLQQQLSDYLAGVPNLEQCWTGSVQQITGHVAVRAEEAEYVARLVSARRYGRLGQLWCSGVAIPWSDFYQGSKPARIALALYPFARERCWVEPAAAVADNEAAPLPVPVTNEPLTPSPQVAAPLFADDDEVQRFLFGPKWMPIAESRPKPGLHTNGAITRGKLLIYPRTAAFLAEALRPLLSPGPVHELVLGSRTELLTDRSWEINVADVNAIATCVSYMGELDTVYFLGGWHDPNRTPTSKAELHSLQAQSVQVLFRLVRALQEKQPDGKAPRLKIVGNRMCAVGADDSVQPFTAGIQGFTRAVMREYPQLTTELIDIDSSDQDATADLTVTLRSVVMGVADAKEWAIRGGRAFGRRLVPQRLEATSRFVFNRNGVYVLIGGAGNVGRQISRGLARTSAARLVWIGRRPSDDTIASNMAEIERLGGQVKYVVADAADERQLKGAIDSIEHELGRIDGVMHLAMAHVVTRIQNLSEEQLRETLVAKVDTTYALRSVLSRRNVGFVVLFSSAESHVGNVGWGAYAAACSFQDAFALHWAKEAAYPVLAINWGYWESDVAEVGELLAAKGIHQLSGAQGLAILERALASRATQVTALNVADHVLERMGIERRNTVAARSTEAAKSVNVIAESAAVVQPIEPVVIIPVGPDASIIPQRGNGTDVAAKIEGLPAPGAVNDAISGLLANVLRIDKARLEVDVDLINYGVDSLIVVAIHKSLEKIVGPLPATLFINFQTIDEIGAHLLSEHPNAARALVGGASQPPNTSLPRTTVGTPVPEAGTGKASLLRSVSPSETARYLAEYGAAFRAGDIERAATQAKARTLSASAASGRELRHLLVHTPTAKDVEVLSVGDGVPVLLLPAVGLVAPTWRHQLVSTLSHSMRLAVPHPPGYGLTKPIKDCSTRGVASTFRDVIDAVAPGRPVHVVASCLGCVAAIYLAKNFPQKIASLTLVGAFHNTSDMMVTDPDKLSADELTNLLESAVVRIKDDFASMSGADGDGATAADFLLNNLCANSLIALRYLTEMLTLPVLDWLPDVRVPTQCIYGTHDKIVNPHQSKTIAAAIPGARLSAIDGAGHFPYLTHSEQFNPMMERFVLQHVRASARQLH
jgi:acyl transferase domain-containing protein/pimeloyl-ACP methyl ester carboxylesterase/acyl carrier protein